MPKVIDDGTHAVSRRAVLHGVGALLPGVALATAGGATAAAAAAPAGAVHGAFSAAGYTWPTVSGSVRTGAAVSGAVFTLTADGRPLAGRRVRFSISSFHEADRSLWFEAGVGGQRGKAMLRVGYLDLDTDAAGTVALDRWLRRGAVPTAAVGTRPLLRAQLVGSETILAAVRLTVV
ncbi:hypothetical protein [Catellatospora tritici]|uniref:hypothetical protein n=1 Tax=Catellatospora tritici TaxID=2851566 RepID=UPI001C2D61DA|nr:hypothetical protein [Catellatospora tritici]MBV1851318.1 hypothetical protein [Catellatospora tritici]